MIFDWLKNPKVLILGPLMLVLLFAVACGGAATPERIIVEKEVVKEVVKEVIKEVVVTATPAPVAATAATGLPGKLTIMVSDLVNERFDMVYMTGAGTFNHLRIVGGFLLSDNEKREFVPGIASRWDVSEDGKTWYFTVRKGVKFHDGSEVTPEDVLWTVRHTFGPKVVEYATQGGAKRISRSMNSIDLDGDTVSVNTKFFVGDVALSLSRSGDKSFHIMPKRATVHNIDEEAAYDKNPIGAGPVRLVKHDRASVMKFERFDDFYFQPKNGFPEDKRVNFQSLDMFIVPEVATRAAALRAGEADMAPVTREQTALVEAGGGRMVFIPEAVLVVAAFTRCFETQYPCHDKRVRQALDYAINKEQIQDDLHGGTQAFVAKGWNPPSPSTVGYTPALDPFPFDPDKARQLLADAGYPGGKGFGKLIVNTFPSAAMPLQIEAAQMAAAFWKKELGLDVEVRVGDNVGTRKKQKSGELNGQVVWREQIPFVEPSTLLHAWYGDPKHLDRAHEDPEIFRIVQEATRTVDADKRAKLYEKLFPILRDETYMMGIGYANASWGVGPRVLTWSPRIMTTFPSAIHTITLKP